MESELARKYLDSGARKAAYEAGLALREEGKADTINTENPAQEVSDNEREGLRENPVYPLGQAGTGIGGTEQDHRGSVEEIEPRVQEAFTRAKDKFREDGIVKDIWMVPSSSITNATQKEQISAVCKN